MAGSFTLAVIDYARERSTVGVNTVTIDALNIAAQDGLMDDLRAAIEAVSLGVFYKDTRTFEIIKALPEPPTDPAAQRELKWLVSGYDAVTLASWSMEIPCADTSLLDPANQDRMDPASAEYTALVTAVEAIARSIAGNAVSVLQVTLVGRSL